MLLFFLLRLMVAALHFNENTSRVQAATKEWNIQYKIICETKKHYRINTRTHTPVKVEVFMCIVLITGSITGYVTSLMSETIASVEGQVQPSAARQPPVSCLPEIQSPPLCSNFVHPEKDEAVLNFRARFGKKETSV